MRWSDNDVANKGGLLQCGETYDATVIEANERVSQKGNDYINLKLSVYADPDKPATQFCVIMPAWPEKLKAFCLSSGMIGAWVTRMVEATDCVGKNCKVVMSQELNDKGYPEIESFAFGAEAVEKLKAAEQQLLESGSIPTMSGAAADEDGVPF